MTPSPYNARISAEPKTFAAGYLFGAPVKDLGWIASLIMGLAAGFVAFFAATFVGIAFIMFWNAAGHHADYTISYRLMGLPAGLLVALVSLAYLGRLWVKRITRPA
jgi:tetrahydromethanopterin S-methyltransferase subunit F